MIEDKYWLSFQEIKRRCKDRQVVLYGRSEDWLPKTLDKLGKKPKAILDRNPNYEGTDYDGIRVENSSLLKNYSPADTFIVVTSSIFNEITAILEKAGWKAGENFCYSPAFKDYYHLNFMKNYSPNLLVSSSDYSHLAGVRSSENGGGIFHVTDQYDEPKKLLEGSFRQIAKIDDEFLGVEYVSNKLLKFKLDGSVTGAEVLEYANYCGLAIIWEKGVIALLNSGKDIISLFDLKTLKFIKNITFGGKSFGNSSYHINDCCSDGKTLFISYFSYNGNWKQGVYDGGVVEFNIDDGSKSHPLYDDLWMPHSPELIDGSLHVCDSMRGIVYQNTKTKLCSVNSFARGLATDGNFYYVGSSENMYISRLKALDNHMLANAGIFMVNGKVPLSRFIPFPKNMNIHDIKAL